VTADPVILASLFFLALYAVTRIRRRIVALSSVPRWAGDTLHFGIGLLVARLDPAWAYLVSALYVVYQILDWRINQSDAARDIATYLAGVLAGLGYDTARLWLVH
jgi:hypothetical protein